MTGYQVYETHNISDPLLPFIYHPDFFRVGPSTRINWHENLEFLLCTDGEGYVQCGTEIFPFRPNDLFVVNADTLHTIGSRKTVTYQCLIVDRSFFVSNGIPVTNLYFKNTIRDPQISSLFCVIAEAYRHYDSSDFCSTATIRSAVLNFILPLCQHYTTERPSSSHSTNTAIKQSLVFIREHINQPITLDHLASHTGLSKYHLSRQFKLATGMTIIEHINLTRCTEAKRLIENGASVSSAAFSCGFQNLSYFSRTYKKHLGELPSTVFKNYASISY